jgi:hypothetical protein
MHSWYLQYGIVRNPRSSKFLVNSTDTSHRSLRTQIAKMCFCVTATSHCAFEGQGCMCRGKVSYGRHLGNDDAGVNVGLDDRLFRNYVAMVKGTLYAKNPHQEKTLLDPTMRSSRPWNGATYVDGHTHFTATRGTSGDASQSESNWKMQVL